LRILVALTYYRPHVSGLTIYVERLARALADRGHQVTVLTSQYDRALPREEHVAGVRVVRVPVLFHVSKGVIMPTFGVVATRLVLEHDVVSLHLPQFDAAGLAVRGLLLRRPTVLTYHCDLHLPDGAFNRVVDRVVLLANSMAGLAADRVVAYTRDYADHSPFLRGFRSRLDVIPPPVVMRSPSAEEVADFRHRHGLEGRRVIGFAARFATEKGIEYLLDALPAIRAEYPNVKVIFAGPYERVLGEERYYERLRPAIKGLGDAWRFVGTLSSEEMPAFFGSSDCLVVPSINSTESFGLVQVEAMLCGTPSVASDLPGVRQPVLMTGMGRVVPVASGPGLAEGVIDVLRHHAEIVRPRSEIEAVFSLERTVSDYEALFLRLLARRSHGRER
jgi:glycosyltransferase involved in cell wall biosynthesis